MTQSSGFSTSDREAARKGVVLSVIGGAVMALAKASGFFLRAIFGGEMWGLYAVAWSLTELLAFFLIGGFSDAAVIFSSRALAAPDDDQQHHRALSKILFVPLIAAVLVAAALHLLAPWIYSLFWSHHKPVLIDLVRLLAWSLPLLVLVQIPAEATRASLRFGAAVGIVQIALPLLSLVGAITVYYTLDASILAVSKGTLLALVLCAPASFLAYGRHFGIRRTFAGLFDWPSLRQPLSFALPQSLNMMLNQGLNRIDSLMLSAFGIPANSIGVYSLVSELTQLIRLAKMAFSGVYSPLVARYRATRNHVGIAEALEDTAQKTSLLGLLLLMTTMTLWPVFVLRDGEAWTESAYFPWLLCAGPMMSTFFGLCGNTLLMLGHSRLLLKNAAFSGLLNLVLNAWFIPLWGLLGAALATAIANITISSLQLVELRRFEKISVQPQIYLRSLLAAAPGLIASFVGSVYILSPGLELGGGGWTNWPRWALLAFALASYALLLALLPGRFPFRRA